MKNMSTTTRMFKFNELRERYRKASKKDKIKILDELCQNFNYSRKYIIRKLRAAPIGANNIKAVRKRGPKPKYNYDKLEPILKTIWLASDQACSKKMVVIVPIWLPFYEELYGELTADIRQQMLSVKHCTIDYILYNARARLIGKGRCTTKPGTLLKKHIPIHDNHWNELEPGFLEADTVAHCGSSTAGNFVWTLTMTDIYSGWTELRATWNKGAGGVITQIQDIEANLPFPIKGFDCDNGSEFLNYHLLRYFTQRDKKVQFTRSRPYRKNDNAHVEQKNWSCVRQLLGYDRIEDPRAVPMMNALYMNEWSLLNNFFIPVMKLEKKVRIGAKIKKIYTKPITPYQRLITSNHINIVKKTQLIRTCKTLNPFKLRQEIEKKLKQLFNFITIQNDAKKRI